MEQGQEQVEKEQQQEEEHGQQQEEEEQHQEEEEEALEQEQQKDLSPGGGEASLCSCLSVSRGSVKAACGGLATSCSACRPRVILFV